MAGGVPTLPRRFLGEAIRKLREESGKTLDATAAAIGKNRVQLIRVIDGKGTISAHDLATLLDFLGADPDKRRDLLALGIEARKRSNRRPYTDLLPNAYLRLADFEALAVRIRAYHRGLIPGPLQTSAYIEAVMEAGDKIWWDSTSSWEERRNRIDYRLARQQQFIATEPAKTVHYIISDEALRTEVGGQEVMAEQLTSLLQVIDDRPNMTIQVIPSTVARNPAPESGLIILNFSEPLRPVGFLPVAYGPSTYFDEPVDTQRLSRAFSRLEDLAHDRAQSREMIADLAAEYADRASRRVNGP